MSQPSTSQTQVLLLSHSMLELAEYSKRTPMRPTDMLSKLETTVKKSVIAQKSITHTNSTTASSSNKTGSTRSNFRLLTHDTKLPTSKESAGKTSLTVTTSAATDISKMAESLKSSKISAAVPRIDEIDEYQQSLDDVNKNNFTNSQPPESTKNKFVNETLSKPNRSPGASQLDALRSLTTMALSPGTKSSSSPDKSSENSNNNNVHVNEDFVNTMNEKLAGKMTSPNLDTFLPKKLQNELMSHISANSIQNNLNEINALQNKFGNNDETKGSTSFNSNTNHYDSNSFNGHNFSYGNSSSSTANVFGSNYYNNNNSSSNSSFSKHSGKGSKGGKKSGKKGNHRQYESNKSKGGETKGYATSTDSNGGHSIMHPEVGNTQNTAAVTAFGTNTSSNFTNGVTNNENACDTSSILVENSQLNGLSAKDYNSAHSTNVILEQLQIQQQQMQYLQQQQAYQQQQILQGQFLNNSTTNTVHGTPVLNSSIGSSIDTLDGMQQQLLLNQQLMSQQSNNMTNSNSIFNSNSLSAPTPTVGSQISTAMPSAQQPTMFSSIGTNNRTSSTITDAVGALMNQLQSQGQSLASSNASNINANLVLPSASNENSTNFFNNSLGLSNSVQPWLVPRNQSSSHNTVFSMPTGDSGNTLNRANSLNTNGTGSMALINSGQQFTANTVNPTPTNNTSAFLPQSSSF